VTRATAAGGPTAGGSASNTPASNTAAVDAPAAGARTAGAPATGGTLYVVATPIGNLADVTLRALEVLRAVPLVAAEDTRLTRRLFARHGLATRLVSYHARNAAARGPELLDHLRGGSDLALVTDAGTPLVSDPGGDLVAAWAAEGGVVAPVPGPSAVLAALVASGVAGPRWAFEGFLPRRGRERRERLERVAADERATVLFEAPGRLAATLADLAVACGARRPAAVCRELTKIHEEVRRGALGDLAAAASAGEIPARGEIVIVVGEAAGPGRPGGTAYSPASAAEDARLAAARAEVERLVAGGLARGEAARRVAAAAGLPRRRLYGAPADR
jgi:16S rRNA (cytidine1402-2'-O)-methyltransferase